MLLERYDNLLNGREVISDDGALLGDKIDSRKSYFRRLNMGSGSKSKSFRSGSYRHSNFHSNRPISQRVLVKAHFKKHGVGGAGGSGGRTRRERSTSPRPAGTRAPRAERRTA